MADTTYSLTDADEAMRLAAQGQLPKDVLANMLEPASRRAYLEACAVIERRYTVECGSSGDPCLESGCSIDHEHGEACLQPVLRAAADYQKAIGVEWVKLYRDPTKRSDAWRTH